MSLLQRIRDSGLCAPSLLGEERNVGDVGFDATISRVLEFGVPNSLSLRNDAEVATDFRNLLEMASGTGKIPGDMEEIKKIASLEQRRSILLAIVGSTPSDSDPLRRLLTSGLLDSIRTWLDDILGGKVGGVDLLLLLLSSIRNLPVTRSMVKDSGLGKKVGSIEKHKMTAGTLNQGAISSRVQAVKNAWNKSVKIQLAKDTPESRKRRSMLASRNPAKKVRVEENDRRPSFSSLLQKVSSTGTKRRANPISKPPIPANANAPNRVNGTSARTNGVNIGEKLSASESDALSKQGVPHNRKPAKRVKWADHFGGNLENAREIEDNPLGHEDGEHGGPESWTDRRKRDRLREKELVAQIKKSKLVDDDDDIFSTSAMKPTMSWHHPRKLPDRSDITKPQRDSKEVFTQATRMAKVPPARYLSIDDVPSSPAPMSDVEQALDMTKQASAVPLSIPFFVPPAAPEPVAAPPPPQPAIPTLAPAPAPFPGIPPQHAGGPIGATAEMLQAMGLPVFLVGSNIQALQTLASTPSLLSTFVDSNGMYDQQRLMNLVHTLSQNMNPNQQQTPQTQYTATTGSYGQPPVSTYSSGQQSQYGVQPVSFGQSSFATASTSSGSSNNGYRGDQNTGAGNLHLTGYGPMTTQAEILTLFSPYVRVEEVVMKNGFCFVNTSDAGGAKQAKEALNGTLVGGTPVRINLAQRRARDAAATPSSNPASSIYGPDQAVAAKASPAPPASNSRMIRSDAVPLPKNAIGQVDYESVRDDRGNPATKNLFVAGYGPGTTEPQLREIFGRHAQITGCVMKGNFTFVNTSDRMSAVNAREALTGTIVNGGVLRINFAKESGRLGTSFDLTYGPTTHKPTKSYYGR